MTDQERAIVIAQQHAAAYAQIARDNRDEGDARAAGGWQARAREWYEQARQEQERAKYASAYVLMALAM